MKFFASLLAPLVLMILAYFAAHAKVGKRRLRYGVIYGILSALATSLILMFLSLFSGNTWYNPFHEISVFVLGSAALTKTTSFDALSFWTGFILLIASSVVLGICYVWTVQTLTVSRIILSSLLLSLAAWWVFQYYLLPQFNNFYVSGALSPFWNAAVFLLHGLFLSLAYIFL